jgi:hypothetical protein
VTAGFVLLALTVVAALLLSGLFIVDLGPALLAVPGGVFVDAIAFLVAGRALSNLSDAGERSAARWRARVAELRQIMRAGGDGNSLGDFERWLPIAIGAGFGGRWVKTFDRDLRAGGADIAWLKAMGSPEDAHATIAMIVAMSGASSAGSSAAGAGAGGGAGGGSSGAG